MTQRSHSFAGRRTDRAKGPRRVVPLAVEGFLSTSLLGIEPFSQVRIWNYARVCRVDFAAPFPRIVSAMHMALKPAMMESPVALGRRI
jgi:hypothetical protein